MQITTFYPKVSSIPQSIYDSLPIPKSVQEAEIFLDKLRISLADINNQLEIRKVDDAIDAFDDGEYLSLTWQKKALQAKRIKEQQIGLVKLWIKQNTQSNQTKVKIVEQLSQEEIAQRQAKNLQLKAERAELHQKRQEEIAKRQEENLRLKTEKLEIQRQQEERLRLESQQIGGVSKKVIQSLQKEVKWLRVQLSKTNLALISMLSTFEFTQSQDLIIEIEQRNTQLLEFDQERNLQSFLKLGLSGDRVDNNSGVNGSQAPLSQS